MCKENIIQTIPANDGTRIEISERYAYKVFYCKKIAESQLANFKRASRLNIPIPKTALVVNYLDTNKRRGFAIKTPTLKGRFYQISMPGYIKAFTTKIINDQNKLNAKKVIQSLMIAYEKGVIDAQFFYTFHLHLENPIIFININFSHSVGDDALKIVADIIRKHYNL